jgi:MFS family permease
VRLYLIINLDSTVLNVALPTLVRDLHATSHQLQWIVDAYALVYGGLVLVGGSLAERVGRKRTFWPDCPLGRAPARRRPLRPRRRTGS